ncbi:Alpha/Beta hydrolase protein [Infundibulicybe gibba]|nr:Alpha/Beta hydrolase protein [Infundibulicybe gibba]
MFWLRWLVFPLLHLCSYVLAAPTDVPSAASFYVPSLPDIHQDPNHPLSIFAGHISSDPNVTRAAPRIRIADKQRLMFWFNGGPGCSSFDGLMMEVGPWRMDGNGGFKVAEGGWEEYTTMVYVDQPAGTGFSYTSTDHYVHTLDEATDQFLEFLRNFYKIFPEYKNMDTYLGGESFAGQYIPYFANALLNSNIGIPLRGAAIGNGWIDPRRQYPSYIDYAVKVGMLEENSEGENDHCVAELDKISDHEPMAVMQCEGLLLDVLKIREKKVDGKDMCVNIYDVRLDDVQPACGMNWPPDIKPVTTYLDRPDVVRALHAEDHSGSWVECRGTVHQEFRETSLTAAVTVIPDVLAKIPVLIFAGDQDLICNYVGLEAMIKAMSWNGGTGLGIFNASHMAPFDVPHVTHDMILRFMGANFSAILDGSARIPSSIGTETKPLLVEENQESPTVVPGSGKTPEQDKAMWEVREAYYNAGSAALVLVLIFLALGTFLWCHLRRRRLRLPVNQNEENIPLNSSLNHSRLDEDGDNESFHRRKGKERAQEAEPIFNVGDSDEDDDGYNKSRT